MSVPFANPQTSTIYIKILVDIRMLETELSCKYVTETAF